MNTTVSTPLYDFNRAQVLFIREQSWSLKGVDYFYSTFKDRHPVPSNAPIPIVDLTTVVSYELSWKLMEEHFTIGGIVDVEKFLEKVANIGAKVTYPKTTYPLSKENANCLKTNCPVENLAISSPSVQMPVSVRPLEL